MMRKSTSLLSLLFALMLVFGAFAAPAFADPDKDESGSGETQSEEDEKAQEQAREDAQKAEEEQRREEEQAREESAKAEEDERREDGQAREESAKEGSNDSRSGSRSGGDREHRSTSTSGSTQTGAGRVKANSGSAGESCASGTAFKIDNLRSNGTFGPITISNFTNTSFTWTSTQNVTSVLVKDGGGLKINAGGASGTASSFGQDISHVIFCLSGDAVAGDVIEQPCDANAEMAGVQECKKGEDKPCDAMPEVAGIQECDEVLPGLEQNPAKPQEKVLGIRVSKAPAQPAAVAPAAVAAAPEAAPAAVLPFTGVQLASFLVAALALISGGGLMLFRRR